MACFISCFAKTIPSYSRDVDSTLQLRSLKFSGGRGGGGKIAPSYFTMIECSLYKENTPYYLFQKKKIILQQHSSRGAQGKLHLRFLINVFKKRGDVKITPVLVYKKAAHFLQIPVLQANRLLHKNIPEVPRVHSIW